MCCRDGTDRPPKPKKQTTLPVKQNQPRTFDNRGSQQQILKGSSDGCSDSKSVATIDLTQDKTVISRKTFQPHQSNKGGTLDLRQNTTGCSALKNCEVGSSTDGGPQLLRGNQPSNFSEEPTSDYASSWINDFPSPSVLLREANQDEATLTEPCNNATYDAKSQQYEDLEDPVLFIDDQADESLSPIYIDRSPVTASTRDECNESVLSSAKTASTSPQKSQKDVVEAFNPAGHNRGLETSGHISLINGSPPKRHVDGPNSDEPARLAKKQKLETEQGESRPQMDMVSLNDVSGGLEAITQQTIESDKWEGIDPALKEEFKDIVELF